MIDPMKYKYLVAIMTADKKAYDITQFVEDVSWEEGEDQLAARISFSAKNDKTSKGRISSLAKPGCYAALLYSYNGGKNAEATRGKIVEWNPSARTSGEKFKVKAYDVLYDLQESQDHVYFSAGVKTKSAIVQVLKRWGIKVTSYSGPNVKHGKLAYKSEKLGTVVVKILKHGIFIGSPVSKDLCNYYLSYLYHYCTNELYEMKTRRGKTTRKRLIYHIMIQMDDIILFGSNKKDLHKAMLLVIEFVKSTLCLKIKDSWSLFRTGYVDRNGKQKGRDLDYMGLVFHGQNLIKRCYSGKTVTIRNVSTRIRASIFLKARRKIHRFAKKIKNKKIIGSKFAMSTIAYNGWFVTTDSFLVRVAECWDQLISMAKNIISRYAKQKSYAMEKYYKKWRKLNYA